MTFALRLVIVTLAAWGVASASGGAAAVLLGRLVERRSHTPGALLQLRLLPSAVSVIAAVLALTAFEAFEPRVSGEHTGIVLWTISSMAAALIAGSIARAASFTRQSRRVIARWMRGAVRIARPDVDIPVLIVDTPFPIIAVVGIIRPRLIIARSVLEACSSAQVDAIIAHERWHLRRGDNLARLAWLTVPDVLTWSAWSRRGLEAWQRRTEDAADAYAAAAVPEGRWRLAEALIRVARLVPPGMSAVDLPASALYRGENIERRIKRLLDPLARRPRRGGVWLPLSTAAVLGISLLTLHQIHEIVEAAVAYLP